MMSCIKLGENLELIKTNIINQRNFSVNVVLLVTSIKSLFHLGNIFSHTINNMKIEKLFGPKHKKIRNIP